MTVVNTPVDQTPELVAQLGAVAVVQAADLRALLLQRVQVGEGGGEGDGETEQPAEGQHHLSLGTGLDCLTLSTSSSRLRSVRSASQRVLLVNWSICILIWSH